MWFSLSKKAEPLPRLDGKVAIVTGSTAGIGLVTAHKLAELGATVIVACRNVKKGDEVCAELKAKTSTALDLRVMELELSSLRSVEKFANDFLALDLPLHILVNNAGVVRLTYAESQDGLEEMFAVNHLGHFLLTFLLLDKLRASAPARIVHVSSLAHSFWPKLEVDTLDKPCEIRGIQEAMQVYGRSKLCNILFSNELAARLKGTGVTSVALHPGTVSTDIGKGDASWWLQLMLAPIRPFFFRSPEKGAQTTLWCAASNKAEGVSGKYFEDPGVEKTPQPQALDQAVAQQLWALSLRLVEEKIGTHLAWPLATPTE